MLYKEPSQTSVQNLQSFILMDLVADWSRLGPARWLSSAPRLPSFSSIGMLLQACSFYGDDVDKQGATY